ncbi:MAG: hypothetical protein FJ318_09125 [SAR202 cluster bacterium]|nr:hypothetical protein [SAR202 cluster bacterium]
MPDSIDRAFLFFHQAVEEDRRSWDAPMAHPAWKFVVLDSDSTDQAAYQIVKDRANWIERRIRPNAGARGLTLSMGYFRSRVLQSASLAETAFSFTHSVFRCEYLLRLPPAFRMSEFSSLLGLDTLNSPSRILEVWLKYRQSAEGKSSPQLGGQLLRFFASQGWPLTYSELKRINSAFREGGFDKTCVDLLEGKQGQLPRVFTDVEADLLLMYGVRNQASHSVTSSQLVRQRLQEIVDRFPLGLFTTAQRLFP